jgi:transcription elongation factor SPT6
VARALSLARRISDPLTEFAKLYNTERDILSLYLHDLQDMVSPDTLYDRLGRVFVLVVNVVGVDFNEMLRCPWKQHLLNFVSGV